MKLCLMNIKGNVWAQTLTKLVMPPRFYVAEIIAAKTPEERGRLLGLVPEHLQGLVITNVTNFLSLKDHRAKFPYLYHKQKGLF